MLRSDATERLKLPLIGIPGTDKPYVTGMLTGGKCAPRR
jgi:hypothetical protein